MALIYDLVRFATSGMQAMQDAQRDWSPYLVHFTQALSLQSIQMMFDEKQTEPSRLSQCLEHADNASFEIAKKIIESGTLRASSIGTKQYVRCVCLSECTLPGLIGHSERYGRFGFVFKKKDIFTLGGRPCAYVDDAVYAELKKAQDANDSTKRVWVLANLYRPNGKIQDYSHEREWRVFQDIAIWPMLAAILVPDAYVSQVAELLRIYNPTTTIPVMPLDMLYDWGA